MTEQANYLLFLRGMDSDQTRKNIKAQRLKISPLRIHPEGRDAQGRPFDNLHWSRFKHFASDDRSRVLADHVFLFLHGLHEGDAAGRTTFVHLMRASRSPRTRF